MRLKLVVIALLVFCCFFVFSLAAQALVPVKKEQLVYGVSAFSGEDYLGRYRDIFCPPLENTIYVLADHDNVFFPTYSLIYFWPDKGIFLADRVNLNNPVEGKLEILKNGNVVKVLDKIKFVYLLPEGLYSTKTELLTGEKAEIEYERFLRAVAVRQEYQRKQEQYLIRKQQLEELIARGEDVQKEALLVPPPIPPELMNGDFEVTLPVSAYLVNVEEGNYRIRIRTEEGKVIEKSEKNLVAISPRREEGVGYELIPEDKYTVREYTADWSKNIYLAGKNIFYLKPYSQEEYNELAYQKAKDPQNGGNKAKWEWVRIEPKKELTLGLYKGEELVEKISEKEYFVRSIPGPIYSYIILEYQEGKMPYSHFSGFKFEVNLKEKSNYTIKAVDLSGGILKTGERKIISVQTVDDWLLYSPIFLPVLVGFLAFAWKKKKR